MSIKSSLAKSEFRSIQNSFPSKEIIERYLSIVDKYGEEELSSMKSLVDHPELSKSPAELFLLYSFLNAQQKASPIEKFITDRLGGKRVSSSLDRGDMLLLNNHYEIKTSTTNATECLNIRQIRLYQKVDYYICSYIEERKLTESVTYLLTKEQMESEVEMIGGFTHGTVNANKDKINPEHSITLPIKKKDNQHVKRWNLNYGYNDLYNILTTEG